jgi:hypothetical protein
MYFYSNPYLDSKNLDSGNSIKFNLACEVFQYFDPEKKENQYVIHYFLDGSPPVMNNNQLETIKDKFYINRTEMNEQFFRMSFEKNLEFMEVVKVQMYMRE